MAPETSEKQAIMIVSREPSISRSNRNEPFAALTWDDLDKLFTAILADLLAAAVAVPDTDVLLFLKPGEPRDESLHRFRKNVKFLEASGATYAERVASAVDQAAAAHYQRLVVIVDHHPLITAHVLSRVFEQLTCEDDCLLIGPTTDGRCYLVGMKANHADLFEAGGPDPMTKPDTLLRRLCEKEAVVIPITPLTPLDSGYSIAALGDMLEGAGTGQEPAPERTIESLKRIEKKYRVKHHAR